MSTLNEILDDLKERVIDELKEEGILEPDERGYRGVEIISAATIPEMKNDGWIPVEERLPEEDDSVILCTKYETVKEGTYTERYGYAMRKGFFTENCFEELCDVTAWMPLPEPYKPEN